MLQNNYDILLLWGLLILFNHLNVSHIQCSEMEVLSQPTVEVYFSLLYCIIFLVVLLDFEHKSAPGISKILLEDFVKA